MWEGYSYVSAVASGKSVGQDLGQSGSCLQRFTTMPFMFCNLNNVCSYAENNDDSIWLATDEPMPMSMTPIPSREVEKYISRCSVCESSTRLIALHSQSMDIPDCPGGWEEAWVGYSYYMHTSDAYGNSHQSLVSPGSCLEEFRAQPAIECHSRGTCNFFGGMTSFWMTVIEDSEQFKRPKPATLKADQTSKVSRCSVCRKKPNIFAPRKVNLPSESLALTSVETELRGRPSQLKNDRRFDASDRRSSEFDRRFNQPDRSFEQFGGRSDQQDRRFDQQQDRRFDQFDRRSDESDRRGDQPAQPLPPRRRPGRPRTGNGNGARRQQQRRASNE